VLVGVYVVSLFCFLYSFFFLFCLSCGVCVCVAAQGDRLCNVVYVVRLLSFLSFFFLFCRAVCVAARGDRMCEECGCPLLVLTYHVKIGLYLPCGAMSEPV